MCLAHQTALSARVKVLIDHSLPFLLAHGGFQIQIEQIAAALNRAGVTCEWLRWWDATQRGDVIHFFGRPGRGYIEFAHEKGIKVVMNELLTGLGSRGSTARMIQRQVISVLRRSSFFDRCGWQSYELADAVIANTSWEAHLMRHMFSAPPERVHIVPNGVEDVFRSHKGGERGKWLVCTATITPRKRVLELAEAAVEARTPVWVIGKPYAEKDPYFQTFLKISANHPDLIRYEGSIQSREILADVYSEARGFVLLSTMETMSLSASEAGACRCPILLSDLPWAHSTFGENARYCPITNDRSATAKYLREFYDHAPDAPQGQEALSWEDVGRMFREIYERALSTSR